jgi:hypothetical protein
MVLVQVQVQVKVVGLGQDASVQCDKGTMPA